jgi:hypothetical protein
MSELADEDRVAWSPQVPADSDALARYAAKWLHGSTADHNAHCFKWRRVARFPVSELARILPIERWREWYAHERLKSPAYYDHLEHVWTTNPMSVGPVLVTRHGTRIAVGGDGWHRSAIAVLHGMTHVPAIVGTYSRAHCPPHGVAEEAAREGAPIGPHWGPHLDYGTGLHRPIAPAVSGLGGGRRVIVEPPGVAPRTAIVLPRTGMMMNVWVRYEDDGAMARVNRHHIRQVPSEGGAREPIEQDTVHRVAQAISLGVSKQEIHDKLVAGGMSEEEAFLAYHAALVYERGSSRSQSVARENSEPPVPASLQREWDEQVRRDEQARRDERAKHFVSPKLLAQIFLAGVYYHDMEPDQIEEYASDPRAAKIAAALRRLGITQAAVLGAGSFGTAARLPDGRVVKITSDPSEVQAAAVLMGKKLAHIVAFYGAWFVEGVKVEVGVGWNGEKQEEILATHRVGIVISQYVEPMKHDGNFFRLSTLVRDYTEKKEIFPLGPKRQARKVLYEASIGLERLLRREGYVDVARALAELRGEGIYAIDAHGGNVGYDYSSPPWRLRMFDIGASSPPDTPKAPTIKAARGAHRATVATHSIADEGMLPDGVQVPEVSGARENDRAPEAHPQTESPLVLTDHQIVSVVGNKAVGFVLMQAHEFLQLTLEDFDRDLPLWTKDAASLEQYNAGSLHGWTRPDGVNLGPTRLPPFLAISLRGKTGKVTSHEGRHRAAAIYARDKLGLVWVGIELSDKRGEKRIPLGYAMRFYSPGYIKDPVTFDDIPSTLEAQFNKRRFKPTIYGTIDPYTIERDLREPGAGASEASRRNVKRESEVAKLLPTIPMYRGARVGDPRVLSGPSYFISSESFARTYGATAQFQLRVQRPLIVSDTEWLEYSSNAFRSLDDIVAEVKRSGHDSVVNVRKTPAGELWVVLLLHPEDAALDYAAH